MGNIKKGDSVIVIAGKDRTKTGKVLRVLSAKEKVLVEGVNLIKKHRRRRKQDEPAGILKTESPIHSSNILLYCSKCKKGASVKIDNSQQGKKKRICKRCRAIL